MRSIFRWVVLKRRSSSFVSTHVSLPYKAVLVTVALKIPKLACQAVLSAGQFFLVFRNASPSSSDAVLELHLVVVLKADLSVKEVPRHDFEIPCEISRRKKWDTSQSL